MVLPSSLDHRGRSPVKHYPSQDFAETLVARPAEIVKNIQKRPSSTASNFKIDRSRESSQHRIVPTRLPSSDDTSVYSSHSNISNQKRSSTQLRPNRFKHPLSAFNDEAVETMVPKNSMLQYQKYHAAELEKPSMKDTSQSRAQYTAKPVALDDNLVPAFKDMTIDMDEDDLDDGAESALGSLEDYDNRYRSSVSDLKSHLEKSTTVSRPSTDKSESTPGTSYTRHSSEHIGRIQQKLNHLRSLNEEKQQQQSTTVRFTNIEQKLLVESLTIEMQNLRRFGYKPLHESLERVSDIQRIRDVQKRDRIMISSPKQTYIKTYNPLHSRDDILPLNNKSSIQSNQPSKGEVNIKKLKTLLKVSSATLDSLWEEYDDGKTQTNDTYLMNTGSYGYSSSNQGADHIRFFKEQLEGYKMNGGQTGNRERTSIDPSPRTAA